MDDRAEALARGIRAWAGRLDHPDKPVEHVVRDMAAEIDRLRAELDKARRGCARDQRMTQSCAIAIDMQRERDTAIAAKERAEDTMRAFKGLRDYLLERNEPHPEEFEAALFSNAWEEVSR